MKFSALNVDINGPSLDCLGLRKPAHEGIKGRYPRKRRHFTVVSQSFVKTVADKRGHAAYHNKVDQALVTSFSVVSTSMTLKDPELAK